MGRARREREAQREVLTDACAYAAVADRANAADLVIAKQHAHDFVINATGTARRSGVTWHFFDPADGIELLQRPSEIPGADMGRDQVPGLIDYLAEHPHGLLVVATVRVDRRAVVAGLS